jgi:hypothetical protein
MDLWLLALIALALIPTVRMFMAASCRPAAEPHGTHPLTVEVTANGSNPNDLPEPDAEVLITAGEFQVNTPSGHDTLSGDVPAGGLFPGREFGINDRMFEGTESPWHWTANCTVSYQCTGGPRDLVGSGTISAVHAWDWDANRDVTVRFVLRMRDITPEGTTLPAPGSIVHRYQWELAHSNS